MAKKGEHRIKIGLVCQLCKSRNYISQKNKMETPEKLVLHKFCKFCKKVTDHKESEKLK
ncbi:MAG TPA: 50S ribosomal protein L33 [Xanthomonadales bacterium]|nr:50S ribosomal protein L33 [Xanthomonadales bacterium]